MINPHATRRIAFIAAIATTLLVAVIEYGFGSLWYANVVALGVVLPLCGLVLYISASFERISPIRKKVIIAIASMVTGGGFLSAGIHIGAVEGIPTLILSIILMLAGALELITGIFYIMMGDRVIITIRNLTGRGT